MTRKNLNIILISTSLLIALAIGYSIGDSVSTYETTLDKDKTAYELIKERIGE